MLFEVGLNARPIKVIAELRPQHVQHPTALGIGAEVELLHGVCVFVKDDRSFVVVLGQHAIGRVFVEAVEHCIAAERVSLVEMRVVRCEALVEPEVAPIFAGHQITKPLVSHLVRIEPTAGVQVFGGRRKDGVVGERGQGGVFHSARREVENRHLVILGPGEGDSDLVFQKRHDRGRVGKRVGSVLCH